VRVSGGGGDGDVAAEADDVVETQLLGQHPVELLVTEAAVGDNAHLDVGGQQFGQPHQHTMLVEAAVVLERALVDGQPHQGRGAAVIGDQRQHDGGLLVGVEVGPVQCHHDGGSCANDVGHPTGEDVIDVDLGIGEQAIDLLGGMLGVQAANGGKAPADGADRERGAAQHAEGGVRE